MKTMNQTEKISKLLTKIVGIALVSIFAIVLVVGGIVTYNIMPKDPKNTKETPFEIKSGWGQNKVLEELESKGIIKNAFFMKIYIKLTGTESFLAGTYMLSPSMDVDTIFETITSGKSLENASLTVRFVEGKKFPYYVSEMAKNFNFNEKDIYDLTSNQEYLNGLIKKYWFITEDILNKDIYYPLEGYIFPDTYSFKKNSTIEEVLERMLDGMDAKLTPLKKDIEKSGKSIHSLLTMASMVELEAVTAEDRKNVAGVFYNRMNINMPMGSDVTTYYAVKKDMTESLYVSEINSCNAYNTRGTCAKLFPVGPVCSLSLSSIKSAITPGKTDAYYFVADKNNKVYFSKTNDEQLKVIAELRRKNLWPE